MKITRERMGIRFTQDGCPIPLQKDGDRVMTGIFLCAAAFMYFGSPSTIVQTHAVVLGFTCLHVLLVSATTEPGFLSYATLREFRLLALMYMGTFLLAVGVMTYDYYIVHAPIESTLWVFVDIIPMMTAWQTFQALNLNKL